MISLMFNGEALSNPWRREMEPMSNMTVFWVEEMEVEFLGC
jgi:hypothetical protein